MGRARAKTARPKRQKSASVRPARARPAKNRHKGLLIGLLCLALVFGGLFLGKMLFENYFAGIGEAVQKNFGDDLLPQKPPSIQKQSDFNLNADYSNYGATSGEIKQYFCEKIQGNEGAIRNTAVSIATNFSGAWNAGQLVDLYLWMKSNIAPVSGPAARQYVMPAIDTLATGGGNCQDQAVLAASLVQSVGGEAAIMLAPSCKHAYAVIYVNSSEKEFGEVQKSIVDIYWNKGIYDLSGKSIFFHTDKNGYWLVFDPVGGSYLGDTYPDCMDSSSIYRIDCPPPAIPQK